LGGFRGVVVANVISDSLIRTISWSQNQITTTNQNETKHKL
jgi:hypothetical protein